MEPQIVNRQEKDGILRFTVKNINVSLINAVRRIILSEIPIIVIRTTPYAKNDVQIFKNTTRLNNEILKQRLSCIPIFIRDQLTLEELAEYEVEVNMKNTSQEIVYVTSQNFKIKHKGKYFDSQVTEQIFPPDPITKDFVLFARLRPQISAEIPGEELHFVAKLSIGNAKENSMFNVASICSYAFTPNKSAQYDAWQKLEKDIPDEEKAAAKENWFVHEGKRITEKDSFDFILETLGVFSNVELIKKAIEILKQKIAAIDIVDLQIDEETTTMKNSFDIILENQDYTIGKALEYALYSEFYEKTQTILFVAFTKVHPHDAHGVLRLSYKNKTTVDVVRTHIRTMFEKLDNAFTLLGNSF